MNPLLLLPGMMCDARLWDAQVAALGGAGIATKVASLSSGDSVAGIAAAVLAEAPPVFALAGLSMGGIVAFEIWRLARHRISHLALLDTNPHAEQPPRREQRNVEIESVMAGGLADVLAQDMKPRYLAETHRNNQSLRELIMSMAIELGPAVFRAQSLALRDRPDCTMMLGEIDVPTLVLCGREDDLCPLSYHLLLAESIPNADLVVLSDCGHLPPLERPEAVSQHLQSWMTRT